MTIIEQRLFNLTFSDYYSFYVKNNLELLKVNYVKKTIESKREVQRLTDVIETALFFINEFKNFTLSLKFEFTKIYVKDISSGKIVTQVFV